MNSFLLNRALGSVSSNTFHVAQTSRLVHNLEPAPGIRFSSLRAPQRNKSRGDTTPSDEEHDPTEDEVAHNSGVNCLAIDKFEGR